MTHAELVLHFDKQPYHVMHKLGAALRPEYYDVLTDISLTTKEMADNLHMSRRTAEGYRYSLMAVGLAKKKVYRTSPENTGRIILEKLIRPMTYSELEEKTGYSHDKVHKGIKLLEAQKRLCRLELIGHYDIFGDLIDNVYFYQPGQNNAVADLVIEHMPSIKELRADLGLGRSLTHHLKKSLPPEIFDIVSSHYRTKGALYAEGRYHAFKSKSKGLETKLENS